MITLSWHICLSRISKLFLMENLTAADTKKLVDKCFSSFFYFPKLLLEMVMVLPST